MARILGVDIPNNKRLVIALTYIYGIGPQRAREICERVGFDPSQRAGKLTEEEVGRISAYLRGNYVLEGDLKRQVQSDIQRMEKIKCYRGLRHRSGLPVRGQGTQKNARTRKGKKKTVAGRKK